MKSKRLEAVWNELYLLRILNLKGLFCPVIIDLEKDSIIKSLYL